MAAQNTGSYTQLFARKYAQHQKTIREDQQAAERWGQAVSIAVLAFESELKPMLHEFADVFMHREYPEISESKVDGNKASWTMASGRYNPVVLTATIVPDQSNQLEPKLGEVTITGLMQDLTVSADIDEIANAISDTMPSLRGTARRSTRRQEI